MIATSCSFSRYELTLERSLFRALDELQRLQAERRDMPSRSRST